MTFRDAQVYISGTTKRRLRWIAKAAGSGEIAGKQMTADELADSLLNQAIVANYPAILDAEKDFEAAERRFAESFKAQKAA